MVATSLPGSDAEAAPPSVEAVREATRAVLPLVDLETVKEREVVAMVEQRLGAMVADTEPLRSAVQDEIDRCLLQDDELLVASGGPAPSTGGAAGAGSGGGPKKKAGPKRKRAGGLDGFVVDDDEDDEDYREEDEDEDEDEDDRGARVRPGAKQQAATAARRYTKAEWRAARHDWSAPAPNPDANVLNANASRATAPPIAAITDEKVHAALSSVVLSGQNPTPATAKALASFLKAPKSDVNKALYRLEKAGKATKTTADGGAPVWTPVGTISNTRGGAETREPSTREYVAPRLRRRPGGPDVEQAEQAVRRHLRADPQRADRARVARQERAARAVPERLGEARQDPRGERDDARARRAARVLRAVSRLGRDVREQEKHAPRLHGGAGRGEVPESEHRGLFLARRGGGRRGCAADQLRGGGKHLDGFVMVVLVFVLLVFPRAPAEGIRFWERDAQAEHGEDRAVHVQ